MKSNSTPRIMKRVAVTCNEFMRSNEQGNQEYLKLSYDEFSEINDWLNQIHDNQDETAKFLETVAMTIKAFGMVNTSARADVNALCDLILNHERDLRTSANMVLQIKNKLISHGNVVLDEELNDLLSKLETPVKKVSKRRAS